MLHSFPNWIEEAERLLVFWTGGMTRELTRAGAGVRREPVSGLSAMRLKERSMPGALPQLPRINDATGFSSCRNSRGGLCRE